MASPIPPISPLNLMSPANSMNSVNALQGQPLDTTSASQNGVTQAGTDFAQFLTDALNQVDQLQKNADLATVGLAAGQIQDLHTVMIALEKANLSLSLTVEVRNKVIEAYQEMMRMQI